MSLHVGLTGGMGGGKSTFAKALISLNVPVFFADEVARALYEESTFLARVQAIMPGSILLPDGGLDKAKLAHWIFKETHLKQALEQLVHPAVAHQYEVWAKGHSEAPFLFREAAILYESGAYAQCDRVVVVTAPEKERVDRLKIRTGLPEKDIRARMQHQWPEAEKLCRADVCFYNLRLQDYLPAAQWVVSWLQTQVKAQTK